MTQIGNMSTLTQVLEKLRIKKIDNEFQLKEGVFTVERGKSYDPDELTIIKTYRFEGESDPADSAILYIIEASDGLIGYSIDAYGVYSNHDDGGAYDNFIRQIKVLEREEQLIFEL
ncbi:MAG: hypothetical protein IPL97_02190 [Niastella sp.]|nr:hypothetical protein [Niastella sp.]